MSSGILHDLPKITETTIEKLTATSSHDAMLDELIASEKPHETEFEAFRLIKNPKCIAFDIGANIGTSALSLHKMQPIWPIYSFEPNISLKPHLDRVAEIIIADGGVYTCFFTGLASKNATLDFYVPRINNWHVIGEASFDLEHFRTDVVARRLSSYSSAGAWELSHVKCPVVRFDDYPPIQKIISDFDGDEVVIVKMDVEGLEEDVLAGAVTFIQKWKPIFMIENTPEDNVPAFLAKFDYGLFTYDAEERVLRATSDRRNRLNLFYVHRDLIRDGLISTALGD